MGLALEELKKNENNDDSVIEDNGVNVVYEKKISPFVHGKVIDYEEGYGDGFTIHEQRRGFACH